MWMCNSCELRGISRVLVVATNFVCTWNSRAFALSLFGRHSLSFHLKLIR